MAEFNKIITFGDVIMRDGYFQGLKDDLTTLGFIEGQDYKWAIAMGDTHPHAITILNPAMLKDSNVKELLSFFKGKSPYREDNNLGEPGIEDMKAELQKSKSDLSHWTDLYQVYSREGKTASIAYAKSEAEKAQRNIQFLTRQLKKIMENKINQRADQLLENALKEAEQLSDVKIHKGKMHDVLGIPDGEDIKSHYSSGESLANALKAKVGADEARKMLAYAGNIHGGSDIFDAALHSLKGKDESINEAEETTATKADETFKTLENVLLDLRNAESKLVMGISYDMTNLFGQDIEAIKKVIENASASVENLAKKMHQQLLQENSSDEERFNNDNRKLNW